jgi:CubicO group peptidase (beta-lactamase class C family)
VTGDTTSGEHFGADALAGKLQQALGKRGRPAAIATFTRGNATVASVNAPLEVDYEIGSVSKGITGLLYADAVARDEVSADATLGELLAVPSGEVASVRLGSLATHTSGLPRLPDAAEPLKRSIALWRHGTNPYGETLDELLEQTRDVKLSDPRPRYSNFGFELLGHAVARAAGMTYAELVRTRLTGPLGMASTYVPSSPSELRSTALAGRSRSGRSREPWTGEAIGPAGGIRSTIGDLSILVAALLDGSAPGIAALDPVIDFAPRTRIGAAWITIDLKGTPITWHNGGTGGFRSWLGLDRRAKAGVVVLSAASVPPDGLGFRMLQQVTD